MVPQIFYTGAFPTAPLVDGAHGGFKVDVRVHLWAPSPTTVSVAATGAWGGSAAATTFKVPAGDSSQTVSMTATAKEVELWWPAGHGAQPLYNLTTTVTAGAASSSTRHRPSSSKAQRLTPRTRTA